MLAVIAAAAIAAPAVGAVDYSPVPPQPEEPKVEPASDEAQAAIASFRMPPGATCDLFAAEPNVANPVAFSTDHRGRVFVCETFRQEYGVTDNRRYGNEWLLADLSAQTVADRIEYHSRLLGENLDLFDAYDDRIRVLYDEDRDGRVDRTTIFADRFNQLEAGTGAGVLVRGNTAYYTNIPHLWQLIDEDGDGVSDSRDSLHYGFGVRVAFRGHDMHGLILGPDGRLYFSIGDRGYHVQTPHGLLANPESGAVFRCELDGSRLEVVATGLRNPQELAFDNFGNLFTGDNNSDSGDKARWVYVVPGGDSGWRMTYQYLSDRGPFNREKIWHPYDPEVTPGYVFPPIANISDGPSGLAFDPGTTPIEAFQNAFLLVDFRGQASNSGIRSIRNAADGAFFRIAADDQPVWNTLATDVDFAPDGSVLFSDWVNGWTGLGKGRIYRITAKEADAQQAADMTDLLTADFASMPVDKLTELLGHADRRVRMEAQFALAEGNHLDALIGESQKQESAAVRRFHAVWGIGQIARHDGYSPEIIQTLVDLMKDPEVEIAVAATNVLSESRDTSISEPINAAIASDQPRLAAAAAIASGRLGFEETLPMVAAMLTANDDRDPMIRHAGIMAMAGHDDLNQIVSLEDHNNASVRMAAVVALRKRADARIKVFLDDSDPQIRLETVRAIHDVPLLRALLPVVAEMPIEEQSTPLLRRVLNANYRLGDEAAARRVVQLVLNSNADTGLRQEAIERLQAWGVPGATDAVTNRFDPLPERSNAAALAAVRDQSEALLAIEGGMAPAVLRLALEYGLPEWGDRFESLVRNTDADPEMRVLAIRGLAKVRSEQFAETLAGLVADKEPMVRAEALRQLASSGSSEATKLVRAAIESVSIGEAQEAWAIVPQLPQEAAAEILNEALDRYVRNDLPAEVRLDVLEAARRAKNEVIDSRLDEIKSRRGPAETTDPVAYWHDSMVGGDAVAGAKMFYNSTQLSCVRCHKAGGIGGEVGPDLSQIGKEKDPRYLLESIVAPGAAIAKHFNTVIVQTEDGSIVSGIAREDNDDELVLVDVNGKEIRIDQDEILGRKEGPSSMPADLMKYLNDRQLRDLVTYLSALKDEQAARKLAAAAGQEVGPEEGHR